MFEKLLNEQQLDLRITNNGRWFDQKVTPDIMSIICELISEKINTKFSPKSLWELELFNTIMERDFGKPNTKDPGSANEYNKVLSQPLHVLASAGIVKIVTNRPKEYTITQTKSNIICLLAGSEHKSAVFLNQYILKVLSQSGIYKNFDDFLNIQTQSEFIRLKNEYAKFIKNNTNINTSVECNRIFSKVINILSYFSGKKGTSGGKMSTTRISLHDIRYNQINFRDLISRKPKHIPRKRYSDDTHVNTSTLDASSSVRKVIKDVKEFHKYMPEIDDRYATLPEYTSGNVEGHHIFSRSEYPELTYFRENIIILTPTQHTAFAHSRNVSLETYYQMLCLHKKLTSIAACDQAPNSTFYSFDTFKNMLKCIGIIPQTTSNLISQKYDDVLLMIVEYYVTA